MCLGCRRRAAKRELVRIVCRDGAIVWDASGHATGRGAYVCSEVECLEQAARRGRLGRALRTAVGEEVVERLKKELRASA